MRIIAGLYRGKKLFSPLSDKIRPTSDKAREAVFDILTAKLEKSWSQICLADVFAGTGAFGLEAMSRGAESVTLVDIDTATAAKNAALFAGEKNKIALLKADATRLPPAKQGFDIIFFDAPYHQDLSDKALNAALKQNWLKKGGICVVETAADEELVIPDNMELIDGRRYGIAKFWFLKFAG